MSRCCRLFTDLLYNLTADVDKRQKSAPSRVYFTQSGSQISQISHQISLDFNREECQRYTAYVKVRLACLDLALAAFVLGYLCAAHVLSRLLSPWARSPCNVHVCYELFAHVVCFSFLSVFVSFWSEHSRLVVSSSSV